MRVILKSRVKGEMTKVFAAFDKKLFSYLLPPGAKLLRFDGSKKGDVVHLKLPGAGEWVSNIIYHEEGEKSCHFVDVGAKIPWPIKSWKHKHYVHADGDYSIIEDNMEFSSGLKPLDYLLFPLMYFAFLPRVRQYKSYFKNLK